MTNQQKKRLEEALEKYNKANENRLSWWEVEKMIGDLNNRKCGRKNQRAKIVFTNAKR